ncbi:MAG: hypothetical protein HY921_03585 [Elusimicrobia bacterium]|nr:hypothetical protein [Elusimicrobiota bacterium]
MGWIVAAGLWASAYAATRRRLSLERDESCLAAGLAASAELVLGAMLCGTLGILRPAPLGAWCLLALSGHAAAALSAPKAPPERFPSLPWPLWPALLALAGVIFFQIRLAWALPVLSWDGLSYHMPIIYRWVSQGNLSLENWFGSNRYSPWNGELLAAALSVLDGGRMDSAKIFQLAALPILAASGCVLGRLLAGRAWSAACALAFASLPIALIHVGIPYVDLLYASFWLAAAAAIQAYAREKRTALLYLFGLAFALALGAKATVYFLAPLFIPLTATWRRISPKNAAGLGMVILIWGCPVYIRNWLSTGNPLFPYTIRVAGITLFPGISETEHLLVAVERWFVATKVQWLWYPFRETLKGSVGYSAENGFGPLFAAAWALLPCSAWLAVKRRRPDLRLFLAMIPATAILFLFLHPTREPRYVIFLPCLAIAGLAALLARAPGQWRTAARLGWSLGVIWCCCGVLAATGKETGLWLAHQELSRRGKIDALEHYSRQYGPLAKAWAELNGRLKAGETVAANYNELVFPLFGLPPRGKVVVVHSRAVDYPGALWAETPEGWLELLDRARARYIFIWSPAWYPEAGVQERKTLERVSRRFCPLGRWSSPDFGDVSLFERL